MNRRHPDPDPVRCALDRAHRETPPAAATLADQFEQWHPGLAPGDSASGMRQSPC